MNALEEIVKMVEENKVLVEENKVLKEQIISKTQVVEKLDLELQQNLDVIDELNLKNKDQEATIAELMREKKELVDGQGYSSDLKKDLEALIKRIQGYDKELRGTFEELTVMQKDLAMFRVQLNEMSRKKVRLENVLNEQVSCLKKLMNIQ